MREYIFSSHAEDKEYRRLRLVEASVDFISIRALEQIGLGTGQRCLDVGPGAGSILRWLGSKVGESGLAMGIDVMVRYLGDLNQAPFEIVEGDVLNSIPDETFDLIHCRYVLIHNRDSARILDRLCNHLKPGGHLVVIEPDFTGGRDLTKGSGADRVNEAICSMFSSKGLQPDFGLTVPETLIDRGMESVTVDARMHLCRGGEELAVMMAASTEALRPTYRSTGRVTDDDMDEYVAKAADPRHWMVYYNTVCTAARKPG